MLDQFQTYFADMQSTELKQYCKMENVSPTALACACGSKHKIRFQLKAMAFHLLLSLDKRLKVMISRLTADIEHNSLATRHLS